MRRDLEIVSNLIPDSSRVLDLGCGNGELLAHLAAYKNVNGYGIEIDPQGIKACIKAGVNVIEQDLNKGLANFQSDSFDTVVMTETVQSVQRPDILLDEMLRIGKQCIITYPNFAHWRLRLYLAVRGEMPISADLPHTWYNTPNIHLCTFEDFESLCRLKSLTIRARFVTDNRYQNHRLINWFPNLFGTHAFYRIARSNVE